MLKTKPELIFLQKKKERNSTVTLRKVIIPLDLTGINLLLLLGTDLSYICQLSLQLNTAMGLGSNQQNASKSDVCFACSSHENLECMLLCVLSSA